MFGNLFSAVKSAADLADATLGAVLAPVQDGVDILTEGLREITTDREE